MIGDDDPLADEHLAVDAQHDYDQIHCAARASNSPTAEVIVGVLSMATSVRPYFSLATFAARVESYQQVVRMPASFSRYLREKPLGHFVR